MIKRISSLFLCLMLVIMLVTMLPNASAEVVTKEKEYKPLDLIVVVDGSGSMLSSDSDRTAPAAIRMLVNMMPAETSRVAIISFNTEPTVLTTNSSGDPDLIALDRLTGLERIRDADNSIRYRGDTGIGNAVFCATELLKEKSDDNHDKAIMLFTDGVNDFGFDPLKDKKLADCDANEASAVLWAEENNCPIYCIGYDYKTSDGSSSMGEDGEGITKLKGIAEPTGGVHEAIEDIHDAEDLLIDFLADVCDVVFKEIETIPGDGNEHSCDFVISPSVLEANIRIKGGDSDSIKNGSIVIHDPSDEPIKLENSDSVRVDRDATAISIKILRPDPGEWTLSIKDIVGDDIVISQLDHFKVNLHSELIFPEGNPENVAYTNDTVGIRTWLTYENEKLTDQATYDAVKSATATCTSRQNPDDVTVIELVKNGMEFDGEFTVLKDSYYDILIRLEWDSLYREDVLNVESSNKPLYLIGELSEVAVNNRKTIDVTDIYSIVKDDENDQIFAEASARNPDVVDLDISGDTLKITGKKWSSTIIDVTYIDEQNNIVNTKFKVVVNDPVALALIIGGIVLVIVAALIGIYFAIKAFFRVSGKVTILHISDGYIDGGEYKCQKTFYENNSIKNEVKSAPSVPQNNNSGFGAKSSPFNQNKGGFGQSSNQFAGFGQSSQKDSSSQSGGGFSGFGNAASANTSFGTENADNETKVYSNLDLERERQFNSDERERKLNLGRIPGKHKNLYGILELFLKAIGKIVNVEGNSELFSDLRDIITGKFSSFKRLKLIGSYYGRGGIKIIPEKEMKTQMVFHTPSLKKNKLALNPERGNNVKVSISIPKGTKTQQGFDECSHIEFIYSKR